MRPFVCLQVMSLLEDAKAGRPLMGPGGGPAGTSSAASGSLSPLSPTSASSLFGTASTPPLSPRSDRPMSPKSPLRRQGSSGLGSHLGSPIRGPGAQAGAGKSSFEAIPQVPCSLSYPPFNSLVLDCLPSSWGQLHAACFPAIMAGLQKLYRGLYCTDPCCRGFVRASGSPWAKDPCCKGLYCMSLHQGCLLQGLAL